MNTYLSVRQRRRVVVGQDRIEWGPCDTFARFALREGEEKNWTDWHKGNGTDLMFQPT
jgi:hypothetical protein